VIRPLIGSDRRDGPTPDSCHFVATSGCYVIYAALGVYDEVAP
jgi:hypothetical protein